MHAIISYHDHSYQPLADRTWIQNKIPYCERHGYHYEFEPLEGINKVGQLQKVRMINRMINTTDYEWLWWTDGTNNIRAAECPVGYKKGRTMSPNHLAKFSNSDYLLKT